MNRPFIKAWIVETARFLCMVLGCFVFFGAMTCVVGLLMTEHFAAAGGLAIAIAVLSCAVAGYSSAKER